MNKDKDETLAVGRKHQDTKSSSYFNKIQKNV